MSSSTRSPLGKTFVSSTAVQGGDQQLYLIGRALGEIADAVRSWDREIRRALHAPESDLATTVLDVLFAAARREVTQVHLTDALRSLCDLFLETGSLRTQWFRMLERCRVVPTLQAPLAREALARDAERFLRWYGTRCETMTLARARGGISTGFFACGCSPSTEPDERCVVSTRFVCVGHPQSTGWVLLYLRHGGRLLRVPPGWEAWCDPLVPEVMRRERGIFCSALPIRIAQPEQAFDYLAFDIPRAVIDLPPGLHEVEAEFVAVVDGREVARRFVTWEMALGVRRESVALPAPQTRRVSCRDGLFGREVQIDRVWQQGGGYAVRLRLDGGVRSSSEVVARWHYRDQPHAPSQMVAEQSVTLDGAHLLVVETGSAWHELFSPFGSHEFSLWDADGPVAGVVVAHDVLERQLADAGTLLPSHRPAVRCSFGVVPSPQARLLRLRAEFAAPVGSWVQVRCDDGDGQQIDRLLPVGEDGVTALLPLSNGAHHGRVTIFDSEGQITLRERYESPEALIPPLLSGETTLAEATRGLLVVQGGLDGTEGQLRCQVTADVLGTELDSNGLILYCELEGFNAGGQNGLPGMCVSWRPSSRMPLPRRGIVQLSFPVLLPREIRRFEGRRARFFLLRSDGRRLGTLEGTLTDDGDLLLPHREEPSPAMLPAPEESLGSRHRWGLPWFRGAIRSTSTARIPERDKTPD